MVNALAYGVLAVAVVGQYMTPIELMNLNLYPIHFIIFLHLLPRHYFMNVTISSRS
jgi:hypothetical protein